MNSDELILSHYRRVAKNFGDTPHSTMQDQTIREVEIHFFLSEIKSFIETWEFYPKILDIGCGNGHLLKVIADNFPQCELYGIEFSPELFQIALARSIAQCHIINGDMRDISFFEERSYDIIITERSVINLLSWEDQYQALKNISSQLSFCGRYLMSESFREPWMELNKARKQMGLTPVNQSIQNLYLTEKIVKELKKLGLDEIPGQKEKNSLSAHFYMSRIFHRVMRMEGGRKKESEFTKFFDQVIDRPIGNYSPILLRVFEKVRHVS